MRAFIIVAIVSLSRSAEIALVFSRSSISLRICRSRAGQPRVNEPAVAQLIMAPRQSATTAAQRGQFSKSFVTADLLDFACSAIDIRTVRLHCRVDREPGKAASLGWPLLPSHDTLLAAIGVTTQLEANVGVRISADIGAALVHIIAGRTALLLRCRQCA